MGQNFIQANCPFTHTKEMYITQVPGASIIIQIISHFQTFAKHVPVVLWGWVRSGSS